MEELIVWKTKHFKEQSLLSTICIFLFQKRNDDDLLLLFV